MGVMEYDGDGIAFTRKRVICDTSGMSLNTIDHLVEQRDALGAEQDRKKIERWDLLTGYVDRAVEYVKSYFR